MAAILRAGPRQLSVLNQVKPVGVPRINWQHPLAQNLVSYWWALDNGSGFIDLVTADSTKKGTGTKNTLPVAGSGQFGTGSAFAAVTNFCEGINLSTVQAWTAPYSFALGWFQFAIQPGATGGYWGIADAPGNDPFAVFENGATTIGFSYGNTASAFSFTPVINTFYVGVGAATGATDQSSWINGIAQTAGTATSAFTGSTLRYVFGDIAADSSNNGQGSNATIFFGAAWSGRALNASEAALLYTQPYCLLLPQETSMPALFVAAAAAALGPVNDLFFGSARLIQAQQWNLAPPPPFVPPIVLDKPFDRSNRLRSAEWAADLPPTKAAAPIVFDKLSEPNRSVRLSEWNTTLPPTIAAIPGLNTDSLFDPSRKNKVIDRWDSTTAALAITAVSADPLFDTSKKGRFIDRWETPLPAVAVSVVSGFNTDPLFDTGRKNKVTDRWDSPAPLQVIVTVAGLNTDRLFDPGRKPIVIDRWDSTASGVPPASFASLNSDALFTPAPKKHEIIQAEWTTPQLTTQITISLNFDPFNDPGRKRRVEDRWDTPQQFVLVSVGGTNNDKFFDQALRKTDWRSNFRWDALPFVSPATVSIDKSFFDANSKIKLPAVWYWYPSTSFTVAPLLVFRQESFYDTIKIINNKIRSTYEWTWWSFPFLSINYLNLTDTTRLQLPLDAVLAGQQDMPEEDGAILSGQQHYKIQRQWSEQDVKDPNVRTKITVTTTGPVSLDGTKPTFTTRTNKRGY